MKYLYNHQGKEVQVEIIGESAKFLQLRLIEADGTIQEFRKKKPLTLEPIIESEESPIPFNQWKTEPFQHQKEFLEWASHKSKFLLLDEPGLGKTKQALDLISNRINAGQIKRALIVCCIGQLQYSWLKEIGKHTNLKGYILGTRPAKKNSTATKIGSNEDKLFDLKNATAPILICNIEMLRNKPILEQLHLMVAKGELGQVVVDEIHKCKNARTSQQAAGLFSLHPNYKLGLTGTPIVNSPIDVYDIANWLGEERRSMSDFKAMYCVMGGFKDKEVVGYQNLDELSSRMSAYSLRRRKAECLDLPEKTCLTLPIELTPGQKLLYKEVLKDIRDRAEDILINPDPMSRFVGLRKVTSCPIEVQESFNPYDCAKAMEMLRLVQEQIANGQKVVIYTWFVFTLHYINTFLQNNGIKPALIYGEMPLEARVANQDAFLYNPECQVMVGNYQSMGTGIELTSASLVLEYELPFTEADEIQGQDRCHRIGQSLPLTCIRLISKNTVDERLEEIIQLKSDLAREVVTPLSMKSIIERTLQVDF